MVTQVIVVSESEVERAHARTWSGGTYLGTLPSLPLAESALRSLFLSLHVDIDNNGPQSKATSMLPSAFAPCISDLQRNHEHAHVASTGLSTLGSLKGYEVFRTRP